MMDNLASTLRERIDEELQAPLEIKAPRLTLEEQAAREAYLNAISALSDIEMHGGDIHQALEELVEDWQSVLDTIEDEVAAASRLGKPVDAYVQKGWIFPNPTSGYTPPSHSLGRVSADFGDHRLDYTPGPLTGGGPSYPQGLDLRATEGFVERVSRYYTAGLEAAQRVVALLDEA